MRLCAFSLRKPYLKAQPEQSGDTVVTPRLYTSSNEYARRIYKRIINGETTINILNISDFLGKTKLSGTSSGLLALTVGKNGVSGELSSAGRNFSATTIAETIGGIGVADTIGWTNRYERKHAGSWGGAKLGIALRSQYGTGDEKAKRQARDIRRGKAELVNDTSEAVTGDGRARSVFSDKKRIYVKGSAFGGSDEGGLALGLVLQHEAYRDGMERSGNSAETVRAVKAHTEMALRMQGAGMGGKLLEGVLSYVPELQRDIDNYYGYMYGLSQGGSSKDAAEAAYAAYVDGTYDSSKDYWKLKLAGTIEAEYDKHGKLIRDLNVEYLDERGNLQTQTEIRDDTGSASRSLARYVGEARARALVGKSFDNLSTY
ncbi:hypothetical protein, partial [uncultured Treponema sp.]|uniref:hypothetical protein n=1 Tax=uncultured Treponema sp. TaxID=162155 RepID=UPI0028E563E8